MRALAVMCILLHENRNSETCEPIKGPFTRTVDVYGCVRVLRYADGDATIGQM